MHAPPRPGQKWLPRPAPTPKNFNTAPPRPAPPRKKIVLPRPENIDRMFRGKVRGKCSYITKRFCESKTFEQYFLAPKVLLVAKTSNPKLSEWTKILIKFIKKSESELFLPPGVGHNDLTSGKAGNRQYNLHTEASWSLCHILTRRIVIVIFLQLLISICYGIYWYLSCTYVYGMGTSIWGINLRETMVVK